MRRLAVLVAVAVVCSGGSVFAQHHGGHGGMGHMGGHMGGHVGHVGHVGGIGHVGHVGHVGGIARGGYVNRSIGYSNFGRSGRVGFSFNLGLPYYGSYYRSSFFYPSYYSSYYPSYFYPYSYGYYGSPYYYGSSLYGSSLYGSSYCSPQVVTKPVYVPVQKPASTLDENDIRDAVREGVRDAIRDALREQKLQEQNKNNQGGNLLEKALQIQPARPAPKIVKHVQHPSTPEGRAKSAEYEAAGDAALKSQNTLQAFVRYEQAIDADEDWAEPHFRQAFNLIAMRRFDRAIDEILIGLDLDPEWPTTGASIDEIYGTTTRIAKQSYLHNLSSWAYEDVRDPRRLFLLGVFLHFDGQHEKADTLFKAAARLSGKDDTTHVAVFRQEAAPKPQKSTQQANAAPLTRVVRAGRQPAVFSVSSSAPAPGVADAGLPPLPEPDPFAPPVPHPPE